MQTIVLASQKGGAGKTTLAAHLAVAAEEAGVRPAVLIDTDPQGSLAAWWNARQAESPALAPCPPSPSCELGSPRSTRPDTAWRSSTPRPRSLTRSGPSSRLPTS